MRTWMVRMCSGWKNGGDLTTSQSLGKGLIDNKIIHITQIYFPNFHKITLPPLIFEPR